MSPDKLPPQDDPKQPTTFSDHQPAAPPRQSLAGSVTSRQLELALVEKGKDSILGPISQPKRPLAWARWRAIEPMVSGAWRALIGQTIHGIAIRKMEDFVLALARDSSDQPPGDLPLAERGSSTRRRTLLADWNSINTELREATTQGVHRKITPLSARTLWRFYSWHQRGRPLRWCSECVAPASGRHAAGTAALRRRVEVDPRTWLCERCQKRQALPAGIEALQDLDRSDKGEIDILPEHTAFLIAAYTGGDSSVRKMRLALERPRSAEQCLEMLKLEIEFGKIPGPVPTIYRARRALREYLPAAIRDYARAGPRRALAIHGPWIARDRFEHQVNDLWYSDFRRSNIRTWFEADGKLYRLYACAIMDVASRDVVFCFDLYPSTNLFKSTLRRALLKWGVPKQIWMDNGKEFISEEISGGETRLRKWRFGSDEETWSLFSKLGIEAHYCKIKNPTGKAPLERFFQNFDAIERELPGWTGENAQRRPERLAAEEKDHARFCVHELPDTPLLAAEQLIAFHADWIELKYRHDGHRGLRGCSPAQLQAGSSARRRIPECDELAILLWHRKRLKAQGDKVSFHYHRRTYLFRADELLALPGDCEVEVHVDPLNADRALAISEQLGIIRLAPVNPSGRSTAELEEEYKHRARLEKKLRQATVMASRLARIPSAVERLEMYKQRGARKDEILRSPPRDRREPLSLPEYAAAAEKLRDVAPASGRQAAETAALRESNPVFTSYAEAEAWLAQHKPSSTP